MIGNVRIVHESCAMEKLAKWQTANPNKNLVAGDFVNIGIKVSGTNEREWAWVQLTNIEDRGALKGIIDNDLIVVTHCKCGDAIEFPYSEIRDYLPNA